MTVSSETLRSISTPDKLDSRLGTLEFVDGVPRSETTETRVRPPRLRARAERVPQRLPGASTYALRKGFHEAERTTTRSSSSRS